MLKHMKKYLKNFEAVLDFLVLTLIIFIPLYMKFPLVKVGGTFVSIRLEDILILVVYIVWFVYLLISDGIKEFFKDKLNLAILVFFFVSLVSVFSANYLTHTTTLNISMLHLLRRVEFIMLMPLVYSVIKRERQIYIYLTTLSIVVFIVSVYAIGQKYMRFPALSTINSELSKGIIYYLNPMDRANSTFAGHYDLAIFLMMAISVLAAIVFYFLDKAKLKDIKNPKNKNIITSAWLILISFLSAVVLVMTAARLSFIAAIVGIASAMILVKKQKYLLLMGIFILILAIYPSNLRDRMVSTFTVYMQKSVDTFSGTEEQQLRGKLNIPTLPGSASQQDKVQLEEVPDIAPGEPTDPTQIAIFRSLAIRLDVEWPRAIRALKKNPLLGTGYSSIGLAIDNDVLRSLGEVGILGTYALVLIIYELFKGIIRLYKKNVGFFKYFTAGILAMIIAFIINSLFIDVFEGSKIASMFWLMCGMALATGKFVTKKKTK